MWNLRALRTKQFLTKYPGVACRFGIFIPPGALSLPWNYGFQSRITEAKTVVRNALQNLLSGTFRSYQWPRSTECSHWNTCCWGLFIRTKNSSWVFVTAGQHFLQSGDSKVSLKHDWLKMGAPPVLWQSASATKATLSTTVSLDNKRTYFEAKPT